jgi:hypothetical protein
MTDSDRRWRQAADGSRTLAARERERSGAESGKGWEEANREEETKILGEIFEH